MINIQKYINFIKLEHTLFSLPLLFTGAYLSENKWPSLKLTMLIILAGGAARIIAMTLNRIYDRQIDSKNPRTKTRHLVTGEMTLFQAWTLTITCLILYLWLSWLISDLCLKLSWIPLVGFYAYPFFKRYTKWTHLGLGLVWSMIPLAGYLAVNPSWKTVYPVIMVSMFSVFWLAGFDVIYALADEDSDRLHGIHSLPAAMGAKKALFFAGLFHVISFLFLVILYFTWLSGPVPVMFLGLIGTLLVTEHFFAEHTTFAFFQVNVCISFLVMLFVIFGVKG